MVLLKNEGKKTSCLSLLRRSRDLLLSALMPRGRVISGGGSAALKASYIVTPWEGILRNAPPGNRDQVRGRLLYGECDANHIYQSLVSNTPFSATSTFQRSRRTLSPKNGETWLAPAHSITTMQRDILQSKWATSCFTILAYYKLNDFLPSGLTTTWTIKLRGSADNG